MIYSEESFLDRNSFINFTFNHLPHWYQPGKLQFITFRLGDSLPPHVQALIKNQMDWFIHKNPYPWTTETEYEFTRLFRGVQDKYLDKGYGECLLKHRECRDIIVEALSYYTQMECYDFVIMPNHIHLLATFTEKPETIIGRLKHYTARHINKLFNRKDSLWQQDNWDRIIRNERHLMNTRTYIFNNPRFLPPGTYTLQMGGHLLSH
ncbi:MAG: transposase [Muribaculaceae bacterium]|nr:transposase [Muribaculaceae bacterium]